MKSEADKLLKRHARLDQLDSVKVTSHVQRERGDRFLGPVVHHRVDAAGSVIDHRPRTR